MVPISGAQDENNNRAPPAHGGSRSHLSCNNTEGLLRGTGVCQVEGRKVTAPGREHSKGTRCRGQCEDKREAMKISSTFPGPCVPGADSIVTAVQGRQRQGCQHGKGQVVRDS